MRGVRTSIGCVIVAAAFVATNLVMTGASAGTATLTTQASPSVPVGGVIFDTATVSPYVPGAPETGRVIFRLYGPDNPGCLEPAVFTDGDHVDPTDGTAKSADFTPTLPGVYRWQANFTGDANNPPISRTSCNDPNEQTVVTPPPPSITTQASPSVPVGGIIFDTATVSPYVPGADPRGRVIFRLYGPDNPTCEEPAAFTSGDRVDSTGHAHSDDFVPTAPGTYRWQANFAGDANNPPISRTACNDPNEQTVVTGGVTPTLFTNTSASVALGGAIHDTATLLGGSSPTGSITFNAYGPDDVTCAGAPAFTAPVTVAGNGLYDSADFIPTAAGVYRWTATYSGDGNNTAVGPTACNDPFESVSVLSLTTDASQAVPLGGPITDTATLAGGLNPTGTLKFELYGPDDATCSTTPLFTSTHPVSGNGNVVSNSFTPAAAGTYRWRATYLGDGDNAAVGPTPCDDPAESVAVIAGAVSPVSVFRPSNSTWYFLYGQAVTFGTTGDAQVPGDYDGSGFPDVAVFRPSTGQWFIQGGPTVAWGTSGDVPAPADYDGDGTTDIAVFRPSTGVWYIEGGPTIALGIFGDIPVPGDYGGDGSDEPAVYRISDNTWHVGGPPIVWGEPGDIPVPADYDGDGTTDIAVFRPSTGTWLVRGGATVNWGTSGDIPVPADYDFDGTIDIAVFRPSTGIWYVEGGTDVAWGIAGDRPLPLPYAIQRVYFP